VSQLPPEVVVGTTVKVLAIGEVIVRDDIDGVVWSAATAASDEGTTVNGVTTKVTGIAVVHPAPEIVIWPV
jgi:hypothetical protein